MAILSLKHIERKLITLDFIKVKILISALLIGYLKAFYFIGLYLQNKEILNLAIAIIGISLVTALLSYTLNKPKKITPVIHLGIIATFLGMMYRALYIESFLITQIQTGVLITMWSFYGLGKRWGLIYSTLFVSIFPIHVLLNGYTFQLFPINQNYNYYFTWIIFLFNTFIIIYIPYLYQNTIRLELKKKTLLYKSLNESIESNKDFTSVISHELRTPLNSVIGITNLLEEKSTDEEEKEELLTLQNSSNNLMQLINKILDFNKMDPNVLKLEFSPLDILIIIDGALSTQRLKINKKSINITKKVDIITSFKSIITDSTRISIAVNNLIEYFLKHSPNSSNIIISSVIKSDSKTKDMVLKFTIENKSLSLNDLTLQQLFDPFSNLNNSNEDNVDLELSIAKRAIENLDEDIEFFNSKNNGLKIQFSLPVTLTDKISIPADEENYQNKEINLAELKVLVVDDNRINIMMLQSLLKHWDIVSISAMNGHEAIEIVKKQRIDIILMDLHMPEISGFETSYKIRDLEYTIEQPYIIAVSASNREEVEKELSKSGINDFISKPVNNEKLKNKLTQYYNITVS